MRILLWHGYLLGGTGSNVYTRSIAREWSRAGHDIVVVSQEANPELYDLGGAQTVRPDIGGLLPVFVLDRYEGMEARLLQDTSAEERARFVEANASALRELAPADLVFANHVLLGGPVGGASGLPFAVKAHGSELEYSMRGNERLPDDGNAENFAEFLAEESPTLLYFGKLIRNKGVHLLLQALERIDARAVIVGFGDYRGELETMAGPNVLFTGPLEHRHLVHLIPLTDVTVVPSIFPEAFGMVVAEAAAGGSIPLVDRHSGLAEIAEALGSDLTSFDTGDVADLRAKLERLLALSSVERDQL